MKKLLYRIKMEL